MKAKQISDYITSWLSDYTSKYGIKGFVIGISGGIDSAVTSTLAARTGLPVLCLKMPIHQEQNQVSRADTHIAFLKKNFEKVSSDRIDLTPSFEELKKTFDYKNTELDNLSLANVRSRLRMVTLYYKAQMNGYLVLGTGNKVEDFGVGFFTKYGDGGVDISPIADLYKSEVYEIAKELGIDPSIIKAKPTDGLWGDDRTDEDQLGASYDELEWAMSVYGDKTPDDFSGRKKEVLQIYTKLHRANIHKMVPIPICEIPKELL